MWSLSGGEMAGNHYSPSALPPGDGAEDDRLKKCLSQEQSALRQSIHGDCLARYIRKFMPIFSI